MARDGSGNAAGPVNTVNPAVPQTVISSTDFNALIDDIYQDLTDSLDRNGKGGMNVPMKFADGNAGYPAITFTNDTDTGIYRSAANEVAVAVAGAQVGKFETTGLAVTGAVSATGGLDTAGALNVAQTADIVGLLTAEAGISANNHLISNVLTPATDYDAATKKYVDDAVTGGTGSWVQPTAGANVTTTNLRVRTILNGSMVVLRGYITITGVGSAAHEILFTVLGAKPIASYFYWGTGDNGGTPWGDYITVTPSGSDCYFDCARGLSVGDIVYFDGVSFQI